MQTRFGVRRALSRLCSFGRAASARALLGALVLATAVTAGPAPIHADIDDGAVDAVTLRGIAFRRIHGAPAALYIAENVGAEPAAWALAAMQASWEHVPALMGLPLPSAEIPLFLFRDQSQFAAQSQQLIGTVPAIERSTCFARTVNPYRAIFCDISRFHNQEEAIQIIGHELTHQVIVGDLPRPRPLPTWYNEGLAEYVGTTLVGRSRPACGAWLWTQREQRATTAIRASQYPRLASLTSSADWRAAADGGLIYAESALAVRWLADHFGVDSVMEVVRVTGTTEEFDAAFERVFGFTSAEFETIQANALRAPVQRRQPTRTQPPPCSIPSLD